MDDKTTVLIINILATIVILTGLGVTIAGIVKKKKLWLAIGVGIALLPTIISWIAKALGLV